MEYVKTNSPQLYDAGLRQYMLSVYNRMSLGVALTGVTGLAIASSPPLISTLSGIGFWVLFGCVFLLGLTAPAIVSSRSRVLAHLCFWAYATLWGALFAPMFAAYAQSDPMIIVRAFFITAATFVGVSLYGYVTKRDLSGIATFLVMAAVGLVVAMLVNVLFIQSELWSLAISGLVVIVFSGLTAYETQAIKSLYSSASSPEEAERMGILGALTLYGSFITLFIHILNILGIMDD